jgi:hypothetical protein
VRLTPVHGAKRTSRDGSPSAARRTIRRRCRHRLQDVRSIRRLKRGREGGEIDSRRLIRHLRGKVGEQLDHAGRILRQEKARPGLARVADIQPLGPVPKIAYAQVVSIGTDRK